MQFLGPNTALLSANSRLEKSEREELEQSLVEMRSVAERSISLDYTLFEFRLRTDFGPRIR